MAVFHQPSDMVLFFQRAYAEHTSDKCQRGKKRIAVNYSATINYMQVREGNLKASHRTKGLLRMRETLLFSPKARKEYFLSRKGICDSYMVM